MEIQKKKCSLPEHKEINANSYCKRCDIYLCNKCEIIHSNLCINHQIYNINKNEEEIFTGFCTEDNHYNELEFFCKTHNILCCGLCLCKIKKKEIGKHKDCDTCLIEDIIDEKRNKLKENIQRLEELSKNLQESINNIKNYCEKINENKEELKQNIQKIFTKIGNEINNQEDELLLELDKES